MSTNGATVVDVAGLRRLAGRHLGYTRWHRITQEQVNRFAEVTGDRQWIHVDEQQARRGPFGATIAHGYLTLSLAPVLLDELLRVDDASAVINYGLNKLRFPAPVVVGSRIRMGVGLGSVEDVDGGVQAALGLTFDLERESKPCCVAEVLFRYYA